MAKIKYYYDTENCKYERIRTTPLDIILNFLGFLALSIVLGLSILFLFSKYFDSPVEKALRRENEELQFYYKIVDKELKDMDAMIRALQERDNTIYRVVFEAEPVDYTLKGERMIADRYRDILNKDIHEKELIEQSFEKLAAMRYSMYKQTKSYDELVKLIKDKSKMLASIPAIQPVSNKELKRLASGFGIRMHPIYKVKKMHTGVDFAAPRGTPVYATGDGVVKLVKTSVGGYGKEIEINHGYGYVTKYAHLDGFNIKMGQRVKRGQCIGYVGNTGSSVAPHLHYEVIHNNSKINPVHFFFNDLNPKEYEKILELASIENQSLS